MKLKNLFRRNNRNNRNNKERVLLARSKANQAIKWPCRFVKTTLPVSLILWALLDIQNRHVVIFVSKYKLLNLFFYSKPVKLIVISTIISSTLFLLLEIKIVTKKSAARYICSFVSCILMFSILINTANDKFDFDLVRIQDKRHKQMSEKTERVLKNKMRIVEKRKTNLKRIDFEHFQPVEYEPNVRNYRFGQNRVKRTEEQQLDNLLRLKKIYSEQWNPPLLEPNKEERLLLEQGPMKED